MVSQIEQFQSTAQTSSLSSLDLVGLD